MVIYFYCFEIQINIMSDSSESSSNRSSYSSTTTTTTSTTTSSSSTQKSKGGFKNNVKKMCYRVFHPRTKTDRLLFALAC